MPAACYRHAMATLQVKNLPEELHASVAERARALHITMSEYVTRALRREVARPDFADWAERIATREDDVRAIDVHWALEAARGEYDPDERFDDR